MRRWQVRRISLSSLLLLLVLSLMVGFRVVLLGMSGMVMIRLLLWPRVGVSIVTRRAICAVWRRRMMWIICIFMRRLVGTRLRFGRGVGSRLISLFVFIRGGIGIWSMMVLIMRVLRRGLLWIRRLVVSWWILVRFERTRVI